MTHALMFLTSMALGMLISYPYPPVHLVPRIRRWMAARRRARSLPRARVL
jgi:hypothetical protein